MPEMFGGWRCTGGGLHYVRDGSSVLLCFDFDVERGFRLGSGRVAVEVRGCGIFIGN